jgi:hypothetical protein
MKLMKRLAMTLIAVTFLAACSTDGTEVDGGYIDENGNFIPTTEVWTVTIEPEYVIGGSYWGAYTEINPQMEAVDNNGKTSGRFFLGEIEGFKFEEGYRYVLSVEATTTDPRIADCGKYTFKLREVLSKTYVGIRTEGQREVTMDVRVVMMWPNLTSAQGILYLSGQATDGSETLDMGQCEIFRADADIHNAYEWRRSLSCHVTRMSLTITPSERPVFGSHCYRIRLKEVISRQKLEDDSVVIAPSEEAYRQKCEEVLYGINHQ